LQIACKRQPTGEGGGICWEFGVVGDKFKMCEVREIPQAVEYTIARSCKL
jgi:hypothetical protein